MFVLHLEHYLAIEKLSECKLIKFMYTNRFLDFPLNYMILIFPWQKVQIRTLLLKLQWRILFKKQSLIRLVWFWVSSFLTSFLLMFSVLGPHFKEQDIQASPVLVSAFITGSPADHRQRSPPPPESSIWRLLRNYGRCKDL